jgi:hypothetical protein
MMIDSANGHQPAAIDIPEGTELPPGKRFRVFRTITEGDTVTNLAWDAHPEGKQPRKPGSVLIGAAAWSLSIIGAGALFVSFAGQLTYVLHVRHQSAPSIIESLLPDLAMLILSLLALGLARASKPSKTVRALVQLAALVSAGMNSGAANLGSPRSIAVWVLPPLVCAVCVDQVVCVIRRHVLAIDEPGAWSGIARYLRSLGRALAVLTLYLLRLVLAPRSTATGLRRMVLAAAPLPEGPVPVALEVPKDTKKEAFLKLYRTHPEFGIKASASRVAREIAPAAGLEWGTARSYAYKEIENLTAEALAAAIAKNNVRIEAGS